MSASTVGTRHGCRVDPAPSVAASCRWLLSLARHAASVLLPDCSIRVAPGLQHSVLLPGCSIRVAPGLQHRALRL
eukprot:4925204-Prymnesium_polylepis.1